MTGCITLTTDYGLSDGFVAACHGVIARYAPSARIIDVTHLIPPGDIARGAAVLAQTVPYLPEGAVHVAVVDPGVGTPRRSVALRTAAGILVGPDNGLLISAAQALGGVELAVLLNNPEWLAPVVSATFHGRDVFAPVAARLAAGADLALAGPAVDPASLVHLPEPRVTHGDGYLEAEVSLVDHFGNVQLAAPGAALADLGPSLRVGDVTAVRASTFGDVEPGQLVAYVDSAGHLALAINGGRAAVVLGVTVGDMVRLSNP